MTDDSWKIARPTPAPTGTTGELDTGRTGRRPRSSASTAAAPGASSRSSTCSCPRRRTCGRPSRSTKPVRRATVYTTALGIHDVHLNGQRVSDDYFNPGWTDYTKRVYYRAYDVTEPGSARRANALGAILADGWYSGYVGFGKKRDHYGKHTRLRAQLHLDYSDGSTEVVATGPGWKAATGPILEADFLMGETYDARLAMTGWDTAGVRRRELGAGRHRRRGQARRPGASRPAGRRRSPSSSGQAITEPKPGVYVLDLGQNFAGVPRLKIRGEPGQKITLRFAERLNPDGTIYTTNLRAARCIDTYICEGKGEETWSPRFTFHGFQYVEITGLKSPPTADTVTGLALSSDTPVVGRFQCSDPMLNKLHSNVYWTQRANFIDIPTDCPQRDERLGWTGDAQVYIRTATLNCDVQAFFTKWLVDLTDGQRADGQFPMVAPVKVAGDDGGPAWADAGVICPWTIYQVYGDRRVLERQYPSMVKFVEFCRKRSTPELLPPAKFHCFGDWLSIGADTPKDVIYTAYFALSTRLTAAGRRGAGQDRGRREVQASSTRRSRRLQQGVRRRRRPDQGGHPGRLRAGPGHRPGRRRARPSRPPTYLVEDIEKKGGPPLDRLHRHQGPDAGPLEDRPPRRGLPAAVQRHLPLVGLLDQARRHQHLGALGRLDAREGLPGPGHELVRPLLVRRGLPVDGREHRRHQERRPGLQADRHRASSRRAARRTPQVSYKSIRGEIATLLDQGGTAR